MWSVLGPERWATEQERVKILCVVEPVVTVHERACGPDWKSGGGKSVKGFNERRGKTRSGKLEWTHTTVLKPVLVLVNGVQAVCTFLESLRSFTAGERRSFQP